MPNDKISITSVTTLVKAAVVGILAGEIWCISNIVGASLYRPASDAYAQLPALALCGAAVVLLTFYLYRRESHTDVIKIVNSGRIDVLAMFALGYAIPIVFGGFGFA